MKKSLLVLTAISSFLPYMNVYALDQFSSSSEGIILCALMIIISISVCMIALGTISKRKQRKYYR